MSSLKIFLARSCRCRCDGSRCDACRAIALSAVRLAAVGHRIGRGWPLRLPYGSPPISEPKSRSLTWRCSHPASALATWRDCRICHTWPFSIRHSRHPAAGIVDLPRPQEMDRRLGRVLVSTTQPLLCRTNRKCLTCGQMVATCHLSSGQWLLSFRRGGWHLH